MLARLDAAEQEVAAIAGLRAGRVRLASFPSATAALLPQAIARLRDEHPGIQVSLVEAEPPVSVELLRAGECDVALDFEYPGVTTDEGADFAKLHLLTRATRRGAPQPSARIVSALVRNPGVAVVDLHPAPARTITAIVPADERKPPAVTAALAALPVVSAGPLR